MINIEHIVIIAAKRQAKRTAIINALVHRVFVALMQQKEKAPVCCASWPHRFVEHILTTLLSFSYSLCREKPVA
ncbi:MAG: hypothetical protein HGB09_07275 [Chlorobiaceae bacterium]|nr:hypothetical protein [Chlorobiaceae bacterium]